MFSNFGLYHGLFERYAVNLTPIEILWRVLTFLSYQASSWLGLDWNFFLDFFSWWFQHQFSSIAFAVLLSLLGILHTLSALRWCFSWFLWLERWCFSAYSFSWLGLLLGLSTGRKNVRGKKPKDYPHSLYTTGSSFIVPLFRRMGSSLRVLCAHAAAEVLLSGLSLGHFGRGKRKKNLLVTFPTFEGHFPLKSSGQKVGLPEEFFSLCLLLISWFCLSLGNSRGNGWGKNQEVHCHCISHSSFKFNFAPQFICSL